MLSSNQKQSFASLHEITYKVGKPFTKIVCACIELFNSELLRAGVKGINVTTHTDAPIGSGLGTSSTLTAAILACICDIVGRRPSAYELAELAHYVERKILGLAGGMQDHYSAAFGGLNLIRFRDREDVLVTPLRIPKHTVNELESSMLMYYTMTP